MDGLAVIAGVGLVVFLAKTIRGDSPQRHREHREFALVAIGFLVLLLGLGRGR